MNLVRKFHQQIEFTAEISHTFCHVKCNYKQHNFLNLPIFSPNLTQIVAEAGEDRTEHHLHLISGF